jgi:hypothetical protein
MELKPCLEHLSLVQKERWFGAAGVCKVFYDFKSSFSLRTIALQYDSMS